MTVDLDDPGPLLELTRRLADALVMRDERLVEDAVGRLLPALLDLADQLDDERERHELH